MIDRQENWCTDCGAQLLPWEGDRYAGRCEGCHEDWERMEAASQIVEQVIADDPPFAGYGRGAVE